MKRILGATLTLAFASLLAAAPQTTTGSNPPAGQTGQNQTGKQTTKHRGKHNKGQNSRDQGSKSGQRNTGSKPHK